MNKVSFAISAIALMATAGLLQACTSMRKAPDPEKIQMEIAAARAEELELVRATIAEPTRAEQFVGLLDERDRLIASYSNVIAAHRSRMALLSEDFSSERREFEAALISFNDQREIAQQELLSLSNKMKQATTASEWKQISKFQTRRLDPRVAAYITTAEDN